MNKEKAIALAGSGQALADLLGISPSAVSQWPDDKDIPDARIWQLKVLRPDWFSDHNEQVPALVSDQAA